MQKMFVKLDESGQILNMMVLLIVISLTGNVFSCLKSE